MKLKSDKTKEGRDIFAETCSSIINRVISFFILLLMLVFPLIYNNSYIDILVIKYQFYWGCVVVMLALCLILSFIMLMIDNKQNQGKHAKMLFSKLHPKNWSETFSITDISVLIFLIILVISTFQSDYFYESFWGNEGRYSGLFLLTLYVAVNIWSGSNQNKDDQAGQVLVYRWAGVLLLSVLAVCFLLFDANVAGNAKRYGALGKYLETSGGKTLHNRMLLCLNLL